MPAPKLKKFTFDVALNLPSRARRFLPLQNLFSDRAPNLSKLKVCLANCKEFQPKSCTALVSLALTIKAKSAILNIWDVLSQTPLLKELTLEGDGRKHRLDGKPRPDRVLKLSSCQVLRLGFYPDVTAYLLSVLEFPALTELMISSEAYVADDGAIVSIFSPSHLPPIIKSLVSSTSELDLEIYDNMIGFIVPFRAISHIPDKCPQPFTAIRETVYDVPYVRTEECKLAFIDCVFHALKMKPEILYLDGWNPDDEWKSYEDDDVEVTQAKENLDVQEKKPKRVATFTEAVWNAILSGCPSVTKMDLQRTLPLWPFIDDLDQPTIKCPSLKQLNISIHPDDFDHRSFDRMLENRKARDAGIDEVELDIDVFDY
ncbi:hypothetical protein SISSUDRAFT_783818 [Sistotremastrum suecicum HHB10207 ss-3]|uniref:F-box domain-containing protein n=1 Tax=Sistotremastrum suecicum HHB10207 ss-3 TaxID=1314776 RepID=A0A166D2L6_9AGAM|nr:hypothetical protein SISSUDRAFT_783818 [Sistotremastrum suecicum HHB10207 ss-3]